MRCRQRELPMTSPRWLAVPEVPGKRRGRRQHGADGRHDGREGRKKNKDYEPAAARPRHVTVLEERGFELPGAGHAQWHLARAYGRRSRCRSYQGRPRRRGALPDISEG